MTPRTGTSGGERLQHPYAITVATPSGAIVRYSEAETILFILMQMVRRDGPGHSHVARRTEPNILH
jgi:hypothetical protein